MNKAGTALFLLVCLTIGVLVGQFAIQYFHTKPGRATPPEARPFEGPIPEVRGFQTALTLNSPIDQWELQARHDAALGATWMTVNAGISAFIPPQSHAAALAAVSKAAHDANLKLVFVVDLELQQSLNERLRASKSLLASPQSVENVEPALAAATAAEVDVIALDSGIGEVEPYDAAWASFITQVKDKCKIPLCYIADFAAAPRVSWWTQVDYVGIRGPIELTDRADFDLHNLQMSYRSRQDVIKYLNLRDHVPVFFFEISYPDQGQRGVLSYQAAVTNGRGQTNVWPEKDKDQHVWLEGQFLRLPENPAAAAPIEAMLKSEWK